MQGSWSVREHGRPGGTIGTQKENAMLLEAINDYGISIDRCELCECSLSDSSMTKYIEHIRSKKHRQNREDVIQNDDSSNRSKTKYLRCKCKSLCSELKSLRTAQRKMVDSVIDAIEAISHGQSVESVGQLLSPIRIISGRVHRDINDALFSLQKEFITLKEDNDELRTKPHQTTIIGERYHESIRKHRKTICELAHKERDARRQYKEAQKAHAKEMDAADARQLFLSNTIQNLERELVDQKQHYQDAQRKESKKLNEFMRQVQSRQEEQSNTIRNIEKDMKGRHQVIPRKLKEKEHALNSAEKQIGLLLTENNHQEATIQTLTKYAKHLRSVAISLKEIALNLPSARTDCIEWETECVGDHTTIRSTLAHQHRRHILSQPEYRNLRLDQFLIENNPLNADCQYEPKKLEQIRLFVRRYGIGNVNPPIHINPLQSGLGLYFMYCKVLEDVLEVRKMRKCTFNSVLEGQNETAAKVDIQKGVILGQYVGNEMLHKEYQRIYNGTREEREHSTYLHGAKLKLPDGEVIDVHIDGIAAGKSSPLLYINDGRVNIGEQETEADCERTNTEFVSVLCNGWPLVLVMTTKAIKAGESLWINYGLQYKLVMDEQELIYDQRMKMERAVDQILNGIQLHGDRPIQNEKDPKCSSVWESGSGKQGAFLWSARQKRTNSVESINNRKRSYTGDIDKISNSPSKRIRLQQEMK